MGSILEDRFGFKNFFVSLQKCSGGGWWWWWCLEISGENRKMLLPGRKNQLYNYRRKITCPGSSSVEKDLEVDWSQAKPGVSCTMVLQKTSATMIQTDWARSLHCLWRQPSSAHKPCSQVPSSPHLFQGPGTAPDEILEWLKKGTEEWKKRRPESSTEREQREEEGIISSREIKQDNSWKHFLDM